MPRISAPDQRYLAMSWALGQILRTVSVAQTYLNTVPSTRAVEMTKAHLAEINFLTSVKCEQLVQLREDDMRNKDTDRAANPRRR